MRDTSQSQTDRGQAYTLEGFVSAMIVLMAVLFALQSVVITPSTGGLADRTAQAQLEQEAQDALVIGATTNGSVENGTGDLSTLVRYWNDSSNEFHNASEQDVEFYYNASNDTELYQQFVLGEVLSDRFTDRGLSYNVELVSQDKDGEFDTENSTYLVYQGESEAVTASYTVTLLESDNLTAPGDENRNVSVREAYEDGEYPIPPATDDPRENDDASEIYNVVEVRVAVW
ncbi:hypothetical protein Htur_0949 [Haloterrigena turkmenica DSM 5511]|uniref:Uncharacterized protein n=1 Tax=Haloterrigena turkmenica (strain ATCC 51198 / DSM 5511 / JCM 9101 / NCIMB 13204 / VKM B-1734 / 4k) TaxID=543526 RepID=D2RYE2_HALTV|nr:hypothetical protein [Haloterrigena turkmenica]ADB59843.1 hypothetical protein Htur_0949 [Haloterrigena turkmenica DSM 5511]